MNTAERIARSLGGAERQGRAWRCRCPVHGGHSLTVADGHGGRLLVKCWGGGCAPADIFRALRRLRLGEQPSGPARPLEHTDTTPIAWAQAILDRARDARGSPVVRYLAGRGINLPPPRCLRWLASCRHPSGAVLPAMIARVDNVDGELVGVHRTYLTADWRRWDRASLGPVAGGAVRLAAAAKTLAVAEGIETALSVLQAIGIPTWAALSAPGLRRLILPPIVETVFIAADNDASGAGLAAAEAAKKRWLEEGLEVRIAMPTQVGTDFNDVLLWGEGERGDDRGQRPVDFRRGCQAQA
jgi:putative DNA primase/helicase